MSELFAQQPITIELPDPNVPDPDNVSYYVLEKERKIYLDGEVCPDILSIQRMILRWNMEDAGVPVKDRKPVRIYIMSYGGDLDYMWSMVDTINISETPIYTINVGVAASAASLIFISGHKRFMFPNARVIIHEGSAQMAGDAIKVMDATESYRRDLKKMKDYILSKTNIPQATLNRRKNNDWTLDAEYCIANGVCDHLVSKMSEVI